jgi:hypothetical protein
MGTIFGLLTLTASEYVGLVREIVGKAYNSRTIVFI